MHDSLQPSPNLSVVLRLQLSKAETKGRERQSRHLPNPQPHPLPPQLTCLCSQVTWSGPVSSSPVGFFKGLGLRRPRLCHVPGPGSANQGQWSPSRRCLTHHSLDVSGPTTSWPTPYLRKFLKACFLPVIACSDVLLLLFTPILSLVVISFFLTCIHSSTGLRLLLRLPPVPLTWCEAFAAEDSWTPVGLGVGGTVGQLSRALNSQCQRAPSLESPQPHLLPVPCHSLSLLDPTLCHLAWLPLS